MQPSPSPSDYPGIINPDGDWSVGWIWVLVVIALIGLALMRPGKGDDSSGGWR